MERNSIYYLQQFREETIETIKFSLFLFFFDITLSKKRGEQTKEFYVGTNEKNPEFSYTCFSTNPSIVKRSLLLMTIKLHLQQQH